MNLMLSPEEELETLRKEKEIFNIKISSFFVGFITGIMLLGGLLAIRSDLAKISYPEKEQTCYYNRNSREIERCFSAENLSE